jgi:hypothetical protein
MSRYDISITRSACSSGPERADSGNRTFLVLAGLYVLALILTMRAFGIRFHFGGDVLFGYVLAAVSAGVALFGWTIWTLAKYRPGFPLRFLWQRSRVVIPQRLAIGLPVVLAYPWVMSAYMFLKGGYIKVRPFAWDATFCRIDFALHGGNPARWLVPYLSSPEVAASLDFIYCFWFVLNAIILTWMTFSSDFMLRWRFWASFVLSWALLGSVGALTLLSAGPCFYDRAVGPGDNPYAGQMAALHEADSHVRINSIRAQTVIWDLLGLDGKIGGASAMPSMHISACVLFTLAGWHRSRRIGALLLAVTLLTQVACVALGWHYAIDGYVAAAGTCLIWWAVGKAT